MLAAQQYETIWYFSYLRINRTRDSAFFNSPRSRQSEKVTGMPVSVCSTAAASAESFQCQMKANLKYEERRNH
jgi:hypothetical protein